MKRADVTDEQVVQACVDFHAELDAELNAPHPWPPTTAAVKPLTASGDLLMKRTGAPERVVEVAMIRAVGRGLIDFGVSMWTAWPTDEGRRLLRESE